MQTGENEQGLRKIIDMTRWLAIILLLLHFYYYCYGAFREWKLQSVLTDRILLNLAHTGLFSNPMKSKLFALLMLCISLVGARGKKDHEMELKEPLILIATGIIVYFTSWYILQLQMQLNTLAVSYIATSAAGFILVLSGGTQLTRIIYTKLGDEVFNAENETFPQEERKLENEYSINLPAQYNLKGKIRHSWINIINPFRALLVMGSPGSGKSYFIIHHIITQHIQKGYGMFIYDFKFDDLTKHAYNQFLKYKHLYTVEPTFHIIDFDHIFDRCNPIDPATLQDIADANESSRTIMLALNKGWIAKGGDFFVESPVNFVTALIWFLAKHRGGKYCTLPHVVELAQVEYEKLFSILRAEPEIEVIINPFITALLNDASEQLEGQVASAKLSLAKLSSPALYYVLSGNDFTLDINNPEQPKIVCIGNNPQRTQTYGAVLSLYMTSLNRMINRKGTMKSSLIIDEFPTIYFNGVDTLVATARSNKVATTFAVQDSSQLKLHYGKEQAEVIMNIVGNIISGQASGETAKQLAERFGKILQDRQSIAINRNDTNVTYSKQLEYAIPASKVASLSSGEFVGMVADDPQQKIKLKMFCAEVINDHEALNKEQLAYKDLPMRETVTPEMIKENYAAIKRDIKTLVQLELERMMDTPELNGLIVKKGK